MKLEWSIQFWLAKENQALLSYKIFDYVMRKVKDFFFGGWGIEMMQCVVSVKWYILNGNKYNIVNIAHRKRH